MAVVERFKQESMYGLSAKKLPVVERWLLVEVIIIIFFHRYSTCLLIV